MLLVLILAAAIWGIGRALGASVEARWLMLALLYVAVLIVTVALPGSGLAATLGGTAGEWLVLGLLGLIAWGYGRGLRMLRGRVRPENRAAPDPQAPRDDVLRSARHIALREIGGPGQKRIAAARVLVVGAGGLGSPALQYLAAAGVGTLGVIDDDVVETTNLQRQVIHAEAQVGAPKVFSAASAIALQHGGVTLRPYHRRLTDDIAADLFGDYDVILDGTDDTDTRYLANRTAAALGLPLVSGAISQWEGQLSVFDPARGAPCYRCVFPEPAAPGVSPSCAEAGVIGPLPGVIGTMMALEALKIVTGAGETLRGRMLLYDGLYADARTIALKRRPDCPDCAGVAPAPRT